MTAQELIAELHKYGQDQEVWMDAGTGGLVKVGEVVDYVLEDKHARPENIVLLILDPEAHSYHA